MRERDALRDAIGQIDPVDERERDSIARTLERLDRGDDPFSESGDPHHVTASAFVVSERGVILHLHRRLGIWVQPGGHVDSDESPEAASLRETREETGLVVRHTAPALLFHVDVHPGPRGHTHYDLRYVLLAEAAEPKPPPGESPEVYWFAPDEALARCEPALAPALAKLFASSPLKDMGEWTS
ncbi:MAG TPA: NUDIX domain-containing protein [Acidimicrobiales bacterium]|nr:NUDIX domain-containing protein [Acidimicrobiales bacterium]HVB19042.1 NUDIX domain-containing protein [Acidimicrobiales bacterium]